MYNSVNDVQQALAEQNYIAERGLATSIFLALKLQRPVLLEGEAGVGKTEVAKVLAKLLDTNLIRLQCYEGLNVSTALYEWNYAQQMIYLRMLEATGADLETMRANIFTRDFLQARPLLQAVDAAVSGKPPVLLIDEIDRADEEFEAFLLEILSDFQVTIPEIGTVKASQPPVVVVTSNRTREIHDALKRRCLYYWIDYPGFDKELEIVRKKAPDIEPVLARQITAFIQDLRRLEMFKRPGVAETLDWTSALIALDKRALSLEIVEDTVGVILKYQDDIDTLSPEILQGIIERAKMRSGATKTKEAG